jgi:hypothetical protein
MNIEIDDELLEDSWEEIESKVCHLLAEGVLLLSDGWWKKDWPKGNITVHVNCNDVFAWGCADSEDVTFSEINQLYSMWKKDPIWGSAIWCIKKRNQPPQEPVKQEIMEAGIWCLQDYLT